MVMESPLKMLSDVDVRQTLTLRNGLIGSNENMEGNIGREIGLLMQEQSRKEIINRERGLNIYRSGSAPPTVEGSMTAVGSLFRHSNSHFSGINSNGNANGVLSEEEIRSHPSYLSYYYSHENLNPRLPPPLLTKEDWRIAQRFQSGTSSYGGIGDTRRKELINGSNSKSLFSSQPGLPAQSGEAVLIEPRKATPRNLNQQPLAEWLERGTDGLIGLAGVGLGSRRKSLADMLQEGLGRPTNISAPLSRPVSHNAFDDFVDPLGASDPQLKHLRNGMESVNGLSSFVVA